MNPENRNKGFTLVELMVALAIAAILAMSLIQIVAPVYRTYQRTLARSDAQMIAGDVLDSIRKGAIRARTVTVAEEGTQTGVNVGSGVYWARDGQLVFIAETMPGETEKVQPVFDPKFYGGKEVTMSVTAQGASQSAVMVNVQVSGGDGELCRLNGVISTLRGVLAGGIPANP